jgi:hypothetical protein
MLASARPVVTVPLRLSPEAVAYIGGGSKWSVSRRLIVAETFPKALERPISRRVRNLGRGAGLMRQPRLMAAPFGKSIETAPSMQLGGPSPARPALALPRDALAPLA